MAISRKKQFQHDLGWNRICLNFAPKCANKVRLFCVRKIQLIMWKTLARKKIEISAIIDLKMAISRKKAIWTRFRRNRICLNFAPKCANNVRHFCVRPVQLIMWTTLARKNIEILAIIDLKMAISRKIAISTRFRRNRICLNFAPKCENKVRRFCVHPVHLIMWKTLAKKNIEVLAIIDLKMAIITENTISTRFRRTRICLNLAPKCANKVRLFCVRKIQLIMWKTLARKKIEISAIIDLKMAISRKKQFQHDLGEIGYAWILRQNVQTTSDIFVSAQSNLSCGRHWQEKILKFWQLLISKWRYHGK